MGLNKCKCSPKHRNKQKTGLKMQYKDKEIRLKALPPTPPPCGGERYASFDQTNKKESSILLIKQFLEFLFRR